MRTTETKCDLCGKVIAKDRDSLIGSLKLKYKAKKSYEVIDAHCIWSKWESVDICPDCLEKITKEVESDT